MGADNVMQSVLGITAKYHWAWNQRDPDAIRALFLDEGELLDPGVGAAVRGDDIAVYCRGIFARYPDLRFELVGENPRSAANIGIPTRPYVVSAYWLASLLAAITGGGKVELTATHVSVPNIGSNGYLPTPPQHDLGGYETWRAKSSYLEVEASEKIVPVLLKLLAKVKAD